MKTAATVIFILDGGGGCGFATAITDGLKSDPNSTFKISKESFDLPLDRYGINNTRASGHITHFVDSSGVKQVSILVLQKYEPPMLACAINEVLSSLAEEDTSTMPSLILPFLVDSSQIKLDRKKSPDEHIYGIQIGQQTDTIQALASRHVKAPSSMQIHHEPLSCALQLVRVLKTASFILIGQSSQLKIRVDDFEIICEIGKSLASAASLQFVKDKVTWNPTSVLKEHESEPWRALYG
ncbi:uncharacterized protein LOC143554464 [Bidens hawaiensis]|uniref:uncharacterized protein LOC143554464 n=1 Tax=Bidens hawaiensis TaxID=980011 RepID=UPI00404B4418